MDNNCIHFHYFFIILKIVSYNTNYDERNYFYIRLNILKKSFFLDVFK